MDARESLKDQEHVSLSKENQLGTTRALQKKQAKLSDFVLDSTEKFNMINEIRGKMYHHALSRQLFVEKHGTSISQKVPSFKGTLMWQSAEVLEKSSIVYLHVIHAFTDRKDVILLALNKLESLFIKTKQLTHIVVSGDFKVYKLLCETKMGYGKEMDWLLPYLGEMHILMNYLAGVLGETLVCRCERRNGGSV